MSTVKTKNVQIGADGTASNNFTIYQPSTPDGTSRWAVGVSGATTADVITVNSSGNVGIGTTSPSYKFQASNTNGDTQVGIYDLASGSSAARVDIRTSGTGASQWFIQTGNTASGLNGALRFYDQTVTSERMRINSSGFLMGAGNTSSTNFGLNWGGGQTTTAFNCAQIAGAFMGASGSGGGVDYPYVGYNFYTTTTNGTYKYNGNDFAAAIRYGASGRIDTFTAVSGTATNNITWVTGPYVANSGTSWTNASDARLKNITGEISDAINKVSQLRAAEFTWKSDESNKPQVGLIAQDLQKVLPEVVVVPEKEFDGSSETAFGVNYDQVIPLLVAAIKEQQTIINELKSRIEVLEGAK